MDDVTAVGPDPILEQLQIDMDRLRGRLFQTIEACGLPRRQEAALKGVIRNTTYDSQADLEAALRARLAPRNGR